MEKDEMFVTSVRVDCPASIPPDRDQKHCPSGSKHLLVWLKQTLWKDRAHQIQCPLLTKLSLKHEEQSIPGQEKVAEAPG